MTQKRSTKRSSSKSGRGVYYLKELHSGEKKYSVTDGHKTIKFGQKGAKDYTKHKRDVRDDKRRNYWIRHGGIGPSYTTSHKETWTKKGIMTAGFWSRWLLWNKPSVSASKSDISRRFGVTIHWAK